MVHLCHTDLFISLICVTFSKMVLSKCEEGVCLCGAVFWFSFPLCLQLGNRLMTVIFLSNSRVQTS